MKNQLDKFKSFVLQKYKTVASSTQDVFEQITNQTLDEDRKAVIKKGRQHVAPVSTSRTKVLVVSGVLAAIGVITISATYWVQVYRSANASPIIYDASKVMPTPVAKLSSSRIYYDEVLFQYNTAIKVRDIQVVDTEELKQELFEIAFNKVYENTAIEQLARAQNVSVSEEEVTSRVEVLEETTGSAEKFEASLKTDYGWDRSDFLHEFKIQLLKEKLTPTAFVEVATKLNQGDSFTVLQSQYTSGDFVDSFNVDDVSTQADLPELVVNRGKELTEGLVSSDIATEAGVFYLERKAKVVNVLHIGSAAADVDLEQYLENTEKFICLRDTGLEYQVKGFRSCLF